MVIDYPSYEKKKKKKGFAKVGSAKPRAYASALLWTLTGTTMATTSYQRIERLISPKE